MGWVKKLAIGSTIAVGTIGLTAGYLAYKGIKSAGSRIKMLIYPPTVKKYVALAAIPLVMYSIKHPERIVDGIENSAYSFGTYIYSVKEDAKVKKISELESRLEKESLEKTNAYSLLDQKQKDLQKQQELLALFAKPNLPQDHNSNLPLVLQGAPPALNESNIELSQELLSYAKNNGKAILVDRQSNLLHLINSSEADLIEKTYSCTTGANASRKQFNGDKASPVGLYNAVFEEKENWKSGFTNARRRIMIPKNLGDGIFITGTYDSSLLKAISDKSSASNGGIVLSASDYVDLENRIPTRESMVEIR